jgi:hypothetical protein
MGHAFPFVVAVQGHLESWLYAMLTNIVVSKVVAFFQKKCIKCTGSINITNNLLIFSHEGLRKF